MLLHPQVREYVSKKVLTEEAPTRKLLDRGGEGLLSSQHQWQFNLLTHVESLQDEVTHRMDSIEKELDGRARLAPCCFCAPWACWDELLSEPLIWLFRDNCVYLASSSLSLTHFHSPPNMLSLTFSVHWALLRSERCQGSCLTCAIPSTWRLWESRWSLPTGSVCSEQIFTNQVWQGIEILTYLSFYI